jgi:hypothetical protein
VEASVVRELFKEDFVRIRERLPQKPLNNRKEESELLGHKLLMTAGF